MTEGLPGTTVMSDRMHSAHQAPPFAPEVVNGVTTWTTFAEDDRVLVLSGGPVLIWPWKWDKVQQVDRVVGGARGIGGLRWNGGVRWIGGFRWNGGVRWIGRTEDDRAPDLDVPVIVVIQHDVRMEAICLWIPVSGQGIAGEVVDLIVVVVDLEDEIGGMWEAVDDASVVPEELSEARSSWMDLLDRPRVLQNEVREEGEEESVELFSGDRLFSEKPIEEGIHLLGEWNDNHSGDERFGGSVWRRFGKPRRRRKRRCWARRFRDCGLCCGLRAVLEAVLGARPEATPQQGQLRCPAPAYERLQ